MNIHAAKGTKVEFRYPNSGYPSDQRKAAKYLTVGEVYTVDNTFPRKWRTEVALQEVPNATFNSVLFREKNKN